LINKIGLLRTVASHTLVLREKWLEIQHKGGGQRKRPQQSMENKTLTSGGKCGISNGFF
jgi:hypothetical protein